VDVDHDFRAVGLRAARQADTGAAETSTADASTADATSSRGSALRCANGTVDFVTHASDIEQDHAHRVFTDDAPQKSSDHVARGCYTFPQPEAPC
jgi:hypothetical protein